MVILHFIGICNGCQLQDMRFDCTEIHCSRTDLKKVLIYLILDSTMAPPNPM